MKVLVFSGDLRQKYLTQCLEEMKYEVLNLSDVMKGEKADSITDLERMRKGISRSGIIVLPTPSFTPDGKVRSEEADGISFEMLCDLLREGQILFGSVLGEERMAVLRKKGIRVHDMMNSEEVAMRNAVATAEGAIAEAISLCVENLHDMNVLVIGYGRCGSVLAQKLKGLCKEVTVMARREAVCTQAEALGFRAVSFGNCELDKVGIIFNTVPAPVLGKDEIRRLNRECVIIDLASAPGGVDYESCTELGIRAKLCSALPGKYAPKTSGIILAEEIERSISCRK